MAPSSALIADAHVSVEELGGDVVGFCSVHEEEGRCWLRNLFVAPTQMGNGIGRARGETSTLTTTGGRG